MQLYLSSYHRNDLVRVVRYAKKKKKEDYVVGAISKKEYDNQIEGLNELLKVLDNKVSYYNFTLEKDILTNMDLF